MGFRVLFAWDALIALVAVGFFMIGLADGSVSSFNFGLWTAILAGLAGILGGGYALRAWGRHKSAMALLLLLAVPGLVYVLFLALVLVTEPRWN